MRGSVFFCRKVPILLCHYYISISSLELVLACVLEKYLSLATLFIQVSHCSRKILDWHNGSNLRRNLTVDHALNHISNDLLSCIMDIAAPGAIHADSFIVIIDTQFALEFVMSDGSL